MRLKLLLYLTLILALSLCSGSSQAASSTETSSPSDSALTPDSGKHCLEQGRAKPMMSSLLGLQYAGWGLEHRLRVGFCAPLIKKPGIVWNRSFIQAGYQQHLSPIYLKPGGYLMVAPFSFLVFNLEAAPILYWPIGLDAAGFYPLAGYDADYSESALPAEQGGQAQGWYLRTGVTLQLAAQLGPVRLIVLDSLQFERWGLGESPFYYHNRNDLPAAQTDNFLDNNAVILAEFDVHPNAQLRVGINDQATLNIQGNKLSNTLAGVVMLNLSRLGKRVVNFSPMFRIGGRTHHPVRQGGINFILALGFDVDLSKNPGKSKEDSRGKTLTN